MNSHEPCRVQRNWGGSHPREISNHALLKDRREEGQDPAAVAPSHEGHEGIKLGGGAIVLSGDSGVALPTKIAITPRTELTPPLAA